MGPPGFIMVLVLIFVPVTGLVTYWIAHEEYEQHAMGPKRTMLFSAGAGLCAAAILGGLVILGSYLLSR